MQYIKNIIPRIKILFLMATLLLITNACPEKDSSEPDSTITIINNSSDSLLYYDEFRTPGDTLIPSINKFPVKKSKEINLILPFSEKKDSDAFIKIFENLENKVFMLFLFDYETVEKVPWDTIYTNYMILRRYDLSKEDLDNAGWTITYP